MPIKTIKQDNNCMKSELFSTFKKLGKNGILYKKLRFFFLLKDYLFLQNPEVTDENLCFTCGETEA